MKIKYIQMATVIAALTIITGCDKLDKLTGVNMNSADVENGLYLNGEKVYEFKTAVLYTFYNASLDEQGTECDFHTIDYYSDEYYNNNIFPGGGYRCRATGSMICKDKETGERIELGTHWGFDVIEMVLQEGDKFKRIYVSPDPDYYLETSKSEMKIYAWDKETDSEGTEWLDLRVRILLVDDGRVFDLVYRGRSYKHPKFHPM